MIDKWLLDRAALVDLEEAIEGEGRASGVASQWRTRLKCPICAETYQHVGAYQEIPGHDNYGAGWGGRGDLIIVPVWCEFEHVWQLCIGQHKGVTFVFVRVPEQQEAAA